MVYEFPEKRGLYWGSSSVEQFLENLVGRTVEVTALRIPGEPERPLVGEVVGVFMTVRTHLGDYKASAKDLLRVLPPVDKPA